MRKKKKKERKTGYTEFNVRHVDIIAHVRCIKILTRVRGFLVTFFIWFGLLCDLLGLLSLFWEIDFDPCPLNLGVTLES